MEKILSSVIPSLVKEGIFGDVLFEGLKLENDKDIGAQFGSTIAFVRLFVKNGSGEEVLPLMIKTIMKGRENDSLDQFMMESLMYKEVLPALGLEQKYYPKMYYSSVSKQNIEDNIIIFENVKYKHYRNSESRTFLDYEHISLALRTIAKFHSLSFILKHENRAEFVSLTEKMKQYSFDSEIYSVYDVGIFAAIERGIEGYEREFGPDEVLQELLTAMKTPAHIRCQLSAPEEPYDVICHGDFCNNNVMYKYDEYGSPTSCILYDFQLSLYGNIAIELGFFLYMHTDSEFRKKYWDKLLEMYWESLREYVPSHIALPKFEDFLAYFGTKAVLGYLICSFFLPMMLDPNVKFWGNLPFEEQIPLVKNIAGEDGEKVLIEIVSHMLQKKYIHEYLQCLKNKLL